MSCLSSTVVPCVCRSFCSTVWKDNHCVMYNNMLSARVGTIDWLRVQLWFHWVVGWHSLLGVPSGSQFAKPSDEEDQGDDSKVAAIDEELRDTKQDRQMCVTWQNLNVGWHTSSPEWRCRGQGLPSPPPRPWAGIPAAGPRKCSPQTPGHSAACWDWLQSDTWPVEKVEKQMLERIRGRFKSSSLNLMRRRKKKMCT